MEYVRANVLLKAVFEREYKIHGNEINGGASAPWQSEEADLALTN